MLFALVLLSHFSSIGQIMAALFFWYLVVLYQCIPFLLCPLDFCGSLWLLPNATIVVSQVSHIAYAFCWPKILSSLTTSCYSLRGVSTTRQDFALLTSSGQVEMSNLAYRLRVGFCCFLASGYSTFPLN